MSYRAVNVTIGGLSAHGDYFPTTLVWMLCVYDLKPFPTSNIHMNIQTINRFIKKSYV